MGEHEHYQARRAQRRGVVWGCKEHGTPAGEECQGCRNQGELFGRTDVPKQRTWTRRK
jgi:hypothetical protein